MAMNRAEGMAEFMRHDFREATEQHKLKSHHWAHMVVHGVLHLLGYDHQIEEQAKKMEQQERIILQQMGIADPYEVIET